MIFKELIFNQKKIRGFLHEANTNELVIMVHGFMGNKIDHHFMAKRYAQDINECGFNVFRFDFLGSGDSDGSFFEDEGIAKQIAQLDFVINHFKALKYNVHLFAYSLGGVIATHVHEDINSLFLLSPAGNFKDILKQMLNAGKKYFDDYEFNGFHINKHFVQEANEFAYFENMLKVNKVKIVQGSKDQYVSLKSYDMFKKIYPNCEAIMIENGDHCYTTIETTNIVRKEIIDFYGNIKNMEK